MPFRSSLLISAALAASACASNPPVPDQAPIDYRSVQPGARTIAKPPAQAAASRPIAVAPPPRVVDMGISPTSSPAVAEAKALLAETGSRPGGAMVQPRDNPSARRIEVLPGDTLYEISRRYSVNMRALIETNRLEPPYALNPGSSVYLPPPNVHRVERGETLYAVSRRYNVDTRSLALLNGLARPWTVWPGDELLLPPLARDQSRRTAPAITQVSAPAPSVRPPQTPKPVPAKTSKQLEVLDSTSGPISLVPGAATPKLPAAPPPQREVRIAANSSGPSEFIWPVTGPVLKGFGPGADGIRNDGVNIDVPPGTSIKAAAAGEVVYAGDELVGFGNLILIRHQGGWVTAYAHSDTMLVKEGDLVNQGQSIAKSGSSGNAGAPQVHFELRKGKEPVDPAEYLPALKG